MSPTKSMANFMVHDDLAQLRDAGSVLCGQITECLIVDEEEWARRWAYAKEFGVEEFGVGPQTALMGRGLHKKWAFFTCLAPLLRPKCGFQGS